MPVRSAGILLHRERGGFKEVFLVHPGGPFWKNKDTGAWSIPKGLVGREEDALAVLSVIAPLRRFDGRFRFPDHAASRMRSAMMPRARKRWLRELVGMFRLRRERGYRWFRSSS
jgi:hypothetical protein